MAKHALMNRPVERSRRFSPCLDVQRTCTKCRHSVGYDGTHLWCENHRIVTVMPYGTWEREPGTDG